MPAAMLGKKRFGRTLARSPLLRVCFVGFGLICSLFSRFVRAIAERVVVAAAVVLLGVSAILVADEAQAQSATARGHTPRMMRLSYIAPASCPDADRFRLRVSEKTTVAEWVVEAAHPEVRVLIDAGGQQGRIEMRHAGAEALERTVEAPNCADLVDALAFVLVVAIDPSAARGQSAPEVGAAAPSPAAEPIPTLPRVSVRRLAPKVRQQIWSLSLGSALETGLTSRPGVGVDVGVASWLIGDHSLEARALRGRVSPLVWAPEFGATLGWLRGASERDGVELTLNRFAVRSFACPFFVGLSARIFLAPCAEVQAGRVIPTTQGLVQTAQKNLPWLTLGAKAALSIRWSEAWVGLSAGAEMNVKPHAFSFRDGPDSDSTSFARTPRWSGVVALILSVPIVRSEF